MQESKNMPQKNLRKGDKRERAHSKGNCTGVRGEAPESMQETESTGEGGKAHMRDRGQEHDRERGYAQQRGSIRRARKSAWEGMGHYVRQG